MAKQKLWQSASLACQYARRTSTLANTTTGQQAVKSFFDANLSQQNVPVNSIASSFNSTANGPGNMVASYAVPTSFLGLFAIPSLNVAVNQQCYTTPPALEPGAVVLQETFETPASSGTITRDCGEGCFRYVKGYNGWMTVGDSGGLEISDGYKITPPEGGRVGELNADSNLAISKRVPLTAGTYELRYFYTGGPYIPVPSYYASQTVGATTFNNDPLPICSNQAADVAWATQNRSRIGVYVSRDETDFANRYLNGTPNPADPNWRPADLVDVCIYARGWVERSVVVTIAQTGDYWLTFGGQGTGAQFEGGQIDNIRLCYQACAGTRQLAPFETSGHLFFREDFRAWGASDSRVVNDYATKGFATGVGATNGWAVPSNGNSYEIWSRPPPNPPGGSQYIIELEETGRRSISRSFILAPGTYQLSYNYLSRMVFPSLGTTTPYCGVGSAAIPYPATSPASGTEAALYWDAGATSPATANWSVRRSTNAVEVRFFTGIPFSGGIVLHVVDRCDYSRDWTTRYATVRITKARPYWIAFSTPSEASTDPVEQFVGGLVGNIRLCAIRCPDGPANQTPVTIMP